MTILQHSIAEAAAAGGYQIARSLRFNSADSAYLTRTYGSAGNRKTWTLSLWLKRSTLGAVNNFSGSMNAGGTTGTEFFFSSGDLLTFDEYVSSSLQFNLTTTQVFRDVSAWYNIVFAVDTTQATASNRIKIYVNGTQVTAFGTATYPTQNLDTQFNFTSAMAFGRNGSFTSGYFNGYMADIYFIDGQALTPSSFGETDSATGVWVPKAYTGTYGTNGFWLKFDDNSGVTATTLGKDSSGNGNNWTPNNFSVTAGVGNDSLVDSPTNYGSDTGAGGEVRGNYCTLNPLKIGANATLANGNLDFSSSTAAGFNVVLGTLGMSSGKWYWEITATSSASNGFGIATDQVSLSNYLGSDANGWMYYQSALKYNNGSSSAYGASFTTNDVIGFAFDADAGSITAYKNGVSQGVMYSGLAAGTYFPAVSDAGATTVSSTANFGQRPFAYTAPSGFKALCTQNLPTPAIGASASTLASKNFDVKAYTGNNSSQSISLDFSPDLLWFKSRSNAVYHAIFDRLRGRAFGLSSNTTDTETTYTSSASNDLVSFDSAGFTMGPKQSWSSVNDLNYSNVVWAFKANGAGVSNTAGSITSTVSANQTAGFSVVTYTGNGSTTGATVGHGLGVAPRLIIVKNRGRADDWLVQHASSGATGYLNLNGTGAFVSSARPWNNTAPTSSVFTVNTFAAENWTNRSADTYVAYCFAEVAGFSKFGSFTANASADGAFVYTGFRPRYVMIKQTDAASNWFIHDTARSTYNVANNLLRANLPDAELTPSTVIDILSNGFKIRDAGFSGNYIFAAFAETPFQYSRAR